ncbi:MAG TPA: class I SAM-dependent methyltransferase [Puia sp.]|nr:class I SAM-dependent methyltransferase [Puia sp.]
MHDDLSLERIVPDQMDSQDPFDMKTLQLHVERYAFAIRNGKPGDVLDIACGTGYGSFQLLQAEKYAQSRVIAVDIDQTAIDYANKRYSNPAIHFVCADAMLYQDPGGYDSIISLETIEHMEDADLFVKKLHSLLKKDGILVASAPVTPSTDGNPHHKSDFSKSRFKKLFETSGFVIESEFVQVQPFSLKSIFHSGNQRLSKTRKNLGKYYLRHPAVFLARVRSLFVDGLTNKYMTLALRKP